MYSKEKIRGLKRHWQGMIDKFNDKLKDLNLDEIFFEESFSTGHRKIQEKYKKQIVLLLLDAFEWRKKAYSEDYLLLWIQLDDILESTMFIFNNHEEYTDFLDTKRRKENEADFYLKIMEKENLLSTYSSYFDNENNHSGYFIQGISSFNDEKYIHYFYLCANTNYLNEEINTILTDNN